MLKRTNLFLMLLVLALAGCGSGGGDGAIADTETPADKNYSYTLKDVPSSNPPVNLSTITVDEYGLRQPSIFYSISVPQYLLLRTAVPDSTIQGWDTASIMTIFVDAPLTVSAGTEYSFDSDVGIPFPGVFSFSNGEYSTLNLAASGTLTFTSWGTDVDSTVAGYYDLLMEDGDLDQGAPPAFYRIAGSFSYTIGTKSILDPAPEQTTAQLY